MYLCNNIFKNARTDTTLMRLRTKKQYVKDELVKKITPNDPSLHIKSVVS